MFSLNRFPIFLLLVYLSKYAECTAKLNVPRVLLPVFKDLSVKFTLEITGSGCYQWSTSRPDLINIEQVYKTKAGTCSRHATITVQSQELTKKTVIVIAEDVISGQSLRADVIIDVISSLRIITKSRELYMEDPPQMFEVRAYDNIGNEFTTLEGVEFKWTIRDTLDDSTIPVISLMTFAESPYETPPSVAAFDSIGKQGHIALLEGIKTGSAQVAVELPHEEYISVQPAVVQLIVVANLLLEPSTVYILPGDCILFKLFQVRQGKRYEVDSSDKQFTLLSQNLDIAIVENRTVSGLKVGKVEIVVLDTYIPDNGTIKLPSALVVVTEPHYMSLLILPFNSWSLTVDQEATIIPEIFTIDNKKIWIGKKSVIVTTVPTHIFDLSTQNENGTVTGIAVKQGVGVVSAKLMDHNIIRLKTENTLIIYPKVTISPKVLILPWVPEYTSRLSHFSFKVSGGDRNYAWTSENSSVVEVTQNGVIKLNGPGSTTVTVYMNKNRNSKASATVHLLPPEEMHFYEDSNEAIIGDDIYLHISLYGTLQNNNVLETVLFSSCSFLDFVVTTKYPFKKGADPLDIKPKGGACAVKTIKTTDVGIGIVTVSLDTNDKNLRAIATVAAHRPLISLQPAESENIILALGSSYDIVYSGGPRPIFGQIAANFSFHEEQFHSKTIINRPELHVYRVTCLKIGKASFELQVTSVPLGYSTGLKAIKRVSINCKVPASFEIISSSKPDCSEIFPQRFISYRASKMRFDVKVYDEDGNVFKNATSLLFKLSFCNETIASFDDERSIQLEEKLHHEYKTPIIHFITAKTFSTLGDVKAGASIIGYKREVASRLGLDKSHYSHAEKISFTLSVVQEPAVEPNFLSLFNHPNNIGHLKVKGGSGHFSFELTSPIVSVNYNYKTRTAEITPITEGGGEVIVRDKCLSEADPPKIEVQVISVASVKISSASKVQEGQFIKVIVRVLDKDEKPLSIPNMHYSKLGLKMESSNPSVADFEGQSKANVEYLKGIVEINLKGKKLGEISICANWMGISSNVVTVQVFPKIKISPRTITLAVGSEIQVKVTGGPSFDAYTHFMISDQSIISISSDSVVKGIRPGSTHVTAMSMGYQREVYSKDVIEVHVIPLTGIHIVAPTTKLGLGNSMPVYASGIPHEISPLLLGSIAPPLQFKWQVSVPNVIQIRDALFNTKIRVSSENKLSVRIFALNPGHAILELLVSGRNPDKTNFAFNCSLAIQVSNKLKWTVPNMEFSHMLMAPNTDYYLEANTLEKEFHTIQSTNIWDFDSGKPLLNVFPDGLIKSGSNYGSAVIAAKTIGADFSVNEIALPVMVKPVHYLMINIATVLQTSEEVRSLPRGLYLNMTISYHDQYGYEFFIPPHSKPVFECNICSKIHIEYSGSNHSIITSLASSGNIILRIHDIVSQTEMEDYIKIPVDNFIVPSRTYLTVGEIVCYWTPLISQNGVWSTDNNIMNISNDGVSFIERPGSATVSYSISYPDPVILASLSVEILPLVSFLIGPVADRSVTNVVGSNYVIPVFLINEKQRKEPNYSKNCPSSKLSTIALPFVCELHYTSASKLYPVERIFSVKSDFDIQIGSFVCVISPIREATKETSTIESNLTLSVTNRKTTYETFFLNFNPQFLVNVDRMYFSQEINTGHIKISGSANVLNYIFIETSGQKTISVGKPYQENSQTMRFVVRAELPENKNSENLDYHILITCSLTMQKEKISIIFDFSEIDSVSIKLLSILSSILVFFMKFCLDGLLFNNILFSFVVYGISFSSIYWILNRNSLPPDDSFAEMVPKHEYEDESQNYSYFRYNSDDRPLLASANFLKLTRPGRNLSQGSLSHLKPLDSSAGISNISQISSPSSNTSLSDSASPPTYDFRKRNLHSFSH